MSKKYEEIDLPRAIGNKTTFQELKVSIYISVGLPFKFISFNCRRTMYSSGNFRTWSLVIRKNSRQRWLLMEMVWRVARCLTWRREDNEIYDIMHWLGTKSLRCVKRKLFIVCKYGTLYTYSYIQGNITCSEDGEFLYSGNVDSEMMNFVEGFESDESDDSEQPPRKRSPESGIMLELPSRDILAPPKNSSPRRASNKSK